MDFFFKIDNVALKMNLLRRKLTLQRLMYRYLLTAVAANARNSFHLIVTMIHIW